MKKINLLLALFVFVFLTIFFVTSCNKEDQEKDVKVNLEEYGFYHNEAIRLYTQNDNSRKVNLKNKSYNQVMTEILSLMKDKYPSVYNSTDIHDISPFFLSYKSSLDYSFNDQWLKIKDNLLQDGKLSLQTIEFINSVLNDKDEYIKIKEKLEILKSNKFIHGNDKKFIVVFESVLESSNKLWFTENPNLDSKKLKNYCNHQMIIADAGAAGCFLWSGPVAAIAGAAASLIAASTGDCAQ